jgi:hypothetical protein
MLAAGYPKALIPFHVPNNITCLCVSPLSSKKNLAGWGDEREHIHISGNSSPICKRHLESILKGIKSYLCLVQTGHVDIEEFPRERKGERHTNM